MTGNDRQAIINYISDRYDPSTVICHRDGTVTAKLDQDQIPGCHGVRLLVGYKADILSDIARQRS